MNPVAMLSLPRAAPAPAETRIPPDFFQGIIEASGVPIVVFECRDGRDPSLKFFNPALSRRTGYRPSDLRDADWWALHRTEENRDALRRLREAMHDGVEAQVTLRTRCKDGSWYWSHLHLAPLADREGGSPSYVGVLRDVSEEHARLEHLNHVALHDALTGLPNRRLLADCFASAAAEARRCSDEFALALIDLDDFKRINDEFGHRFGDEVLCTVAKRLTRAVRPEDTVARLGGDEFAILLRSPQYYGSLGAFAARARSSVGATLMIQGRPILLSCSIGTGLYPLDDVGLDGLLELADRRMYADKRGGAPQAP